MDPCRQCGSVEKWGRKCKPCARAAHDRWRKKNPRAHSAASARTQAANGEWLSNFKVACGCIDCGYNAHAAALDFDHLDSGTKHRGLAQMRSYSRVRIEAEVAKCVVRCANCHRIKTQRERA